MEEAPRNRDESNGYEQVTDSDNVENREFTPDVMSAMELQEDTSIDLGNETHAETPTDITKLIEQFRTDFRDLELTETQAAKFIHAYREQYVRKEYPPEDARLIYLERFIKKDNVDKLVKESTTTSFLTGRKRAAAAKTRKEQLAKEAETIQSGTLDEEIWAPTLVGELRRERMHSGGGTYIHYYDAHGGTYFIGPDGESSNERYAKLYGEYVNLAPFAPVCSFEDPTRKVKLKRFLAESSHTIDASEMKPEDCELIDPMAVPDPTHSFASAVMFNFFTGCSDAVIAWTRREKNQIVRKDGVYYLFDLSNRTSTWKVDATEKQFVELEAFLENQPEDTLDDLFSYMCDTAIVFTCTNDPIDATTGMARDSKSSFLQNLHEQILKSTLSEKYKQKLTGALAASITKYLGNT